MEKSNKKGKNDKGNKNNSSKHKNPSEFTSNKILNFYKLKNTNSFISCHGRPTGKDLKFFKMAYGMNYVLTLQNPKEKPEEIKKICDENNIRWQLIELYGANLPYFEKRDTQKLISTNLEELYKILKNEKIILFIHCAAGIHRTGTVLYSLLRIFGESAESALRAIEFIRLETRNQVGDSRISYAEKFIVPSLYKAVYGEEFELIFNKQSSETEENKVKEIEEKTSEINLNENKENNI